MKIDVKRRKGFTGPVTIGVPLPPGVKGIDAKPLTIPANKNDAVVSHHGRRQRLAGSVGKPGGAGPDGLSWQSRSRRAHQFEGRAVGTQFEVVP